MKNIYSNQLFVRKLIWRLLPAQLISIFVTNLSSLIDGILIGRKLVPNALTAYGLISPFTMIINAIATIFSTGALILCGKELGKEKNNNPNKIFSVTLLFAFVFGILLSIVCLCIPTQIASLLGAKSDVIDLAVEYLKGISYGLPILMILPILLCFLQYGNGNLILIVSSLISAVFKLILDLYSIYKTDNVMLCIGLSTLLANSFSLIFLIVVYKLNKNLNKLVISKDMFKYLPLVIVFGIPSAAINVLFALRNIVLNNVALKVGGNIAVNSVSICSTIGLLSIVNNGMIVIVSMLASYFSSKEDRASLISLLKESFVIEFVFNFVFATICTIFGKQIATLFGSHQPEITRTAIAFYTWSWITFALTVNSVNIYKCLGKIKEVNILLVFQCFVFHLIGIYALSSIFGLKGLWIDYVLADLLAFFTFIIYATIKNHRFPKSLEETFCFNKNFGSDDRLVLLINESTENSYEEYISNYCSNMDISTQIIKNIKDYANFKIDNELNIIYKNDKYIMRIRNFDNDSSFKNNPSYTNVFKFNEIVFEL